MQNARASYEEAGRYFKGKKMSGLMRYARGNESRDFFKEIKLPLVPTEVPVTLYEGSGTGSEGVDRREIQTTIPVLDVHEILDYLQCHLQLRTPLHRVQQYWRHLRARGNPFAENLGAADDSIVPFTLYGDEVVLAKDSKDKVTGLFLQLTLFKPRVVREGLWLLCAIQDSVMVHANLKTLLPVLQHIVWSCNIAFTGRYPATAMDGTPLTGVKAKKAGTEFAFGTRWVCAELRGDWKWHERTLRLLRTPVSKRMCFLCNAEASDGHLRYYDILDGAAWRSSQLDLNSFLQGAIRPGARSPFLDLRGFDISMIRFCSMHVCNLGLVHTASGGALEALLREGHFGGYIAGDATSLKTCLQTAFMEFQQWRRSNKTPCSQKAFAPRHLWKAQHGYYFTAKAYNARIVMLWLAHKCQQCAVHAPVNSSMPLHATALTAFSKWFNATEAAGRYLTRQQNDEIYVNGMLFLKCHLRLTQVSHRQKIVAWILKPKFHAMLHLLDQSHKWCYNTRYSHCFAGEDSMGWLKRISLRAPRKPGPFNRWILRMGQLKLIAAKRRLTKRVREQGWKR
ncbi:unnamed protein product [Symbiodinium sp. CCMP2456]|nr:unnamed protein product [Symbiodinium sp. CCMP2456]